MAYQSCLCPLGNHDETDLDETDRDEIKVRIEFLEELPQKQVRKLRELKKRSISREGI